MSEQIKTRIAVIIGSTRPDRNGDIIGIERKGEAVGRWVYDLAVKRDDAEFELIDLKEVDLPLLDEPLPPSFGQYTQPHTVKWAEKIASFDGFVFVTPEYNASTSAALKNAIDFLYAEWRDKAAGFVGYGAVGGAHAVQHLRTILAELDVASVSAQVSLGLYTDFVELQYFQPGAHQAEALTAMLDQLVAWAAALRPLRG
jgi:NAD(P)H-dependent FMN reductase